MIFCPQCGAQYRDGFTQCSDCQVSLVSHSPDRPEETEPQLDLTLVSVFETGDPAILALAKSILEEAGIEYYARGEGIQDLFGAGRVGVGYNPLVGPVSIQVREENEEESIELLRELKEDVI